MLGALMIRRNVKTTMPFRDLHRWLSLADYTDAKEHATEQIIARYSRGNVCVQNGSYIDSDKLSRLSERGDEAMSRLRRLVSKGRLVSKDQA
jgi:hypothetical protein